MTAMIGLTSTTISAPQLQGECYIHPACNTVHCQYSRWNEMLLRSRYIAFMAAVPVHVQRVIADLANPADMDCEQTLE